MNARAIRPVLRPALQPILLPVFLAALCAGCANWRSVARYEAWTLYETPDSSVSVEAYENAFEPAFEAVSRTLGPFEGRVRVHAWHGAVSMDGSDESLIGDEAHAGVQHVPGIGPARIQAYHARGGAGPFSRSGIFIGVPDPGTATHELVHARLAEQDVSLPLWFEEGVATLLGDGFLMDERWVIDGLACWPLRELREESLSDETLAHLLEMTASDRASVRDNVLVHFVGWAVVFDLYRETGVLDWRAWQARFDFGDPLGEARARLKRTLSDQAPLEWLERLEDPDPGLRLGAAKGTWKLRSRLVLARLLEALAHERHPEVRVGLAVNALAAAGEIRLSWRDWRRVEAGVRRALHESVLSDPAEQAAVLDLYRAYRYGNGKQRAQDALQRLSRFWEE